MRRIRFLAAFSGVAFLFVACGLPRIDTTTEETTKESLEKVRSSLSEDKKKEFDEAVRWVAMSEIKLEDLMNSGSEDPRAAMEKASASLDGMTADDVLGKADELREGRGRKEKEQALAEIKELEERRIAAEKATSALSAFKVLRSRLYEKERRFGSAEPIVELTVENSTEHPISRAFFKGTVSSPGRSIPWLVEDFNYPIKGGLEPGEKASWKLSPSRFSAWGTVAAPADAIFTVVVTRLDGVDDETLFDTDGFSETDAVRLEKLKEQYLN